MNLADLLQQRPPQTGGLIPQAGVMPQGMPQGIPQGMPQGIPQGMPPPQMGAPRQQLTPQQLEMLLKMLGNSQPTPFAPIQTSAPRG